MCSGCMQDLSSQLCVHSSYCEVYQEGVYDLMVTAAPLQRKRIQLKVREDAQGQVSVQGLSQVRDVICLRWGPQCVVYLWNQMLSGKLSSSDMGERIILKDSGARSESGKGMCVRSRNFPQTRTYLPEES